MPHTTLSGRRASAFDRALACGEGGAAVSALRSSALALAQAPLGPDDAFRVRLRERLAAEMATLTASPPAPARRRATPPRGAPARRRWVWIGAAGLASVMAGGVVATAAAAALPGQTFYPVKLAAEQAELDLTGGTVARGRLELEFAATRLAEVRDLLAEPGLSGTRRAALLSATLQALGGEAVAGAADLTQAWRVDHSLTALVILDHFIAVSSANLDDLLPSLPSSAVPAGTRTRSLLAHLEVQAHASSRARSTRTRAGRRDGSTGPDASQSGVPVGGGGATGTATTVPSGAAVDILGTVNDLPVLPDRSTNSAPSETTPATPAPSPAPAASPHARTKPSHPKSQSPLGVPLPGLGSGLPPDTLP